MKEVQHRLAGAWASNERSLRRLAVALQRKGAGPGVRLRFHTSNKQYRIHDDSITLIDLAGILGAAEIALPETGHHDMPACYVLKERAAKWGVRIVK